MASGFVIGDPVAGAPPRGLRRMAERPDIPVLRMCMTEATLSTESTLARQEAAAGSLPALTNGAPRYRSEGPAGADVSARCTYPPGLALDTSRPWSRERNDADV